MKRFGFSMCLMLGAFATPLISLAAVPPDTVVTYIPPDQQISVVTVFADARHYVQALVILLLLAAVAALATWAAVLVRPTTYDRTAKAVAVLAAVAAIAPMVGFLAGADNLLHIFTGIANKRPAATIVMLAPGLAETALCVTLGLLAGTISVMGRRHLGLLLAGRTDAARDALRPPPRIS